MLAAPGNAVIISALFFSEMQTTASLPSATPDTPPTTSRFDNSFLGAGLIALALLAVAAGVLWLWRSSQPPAPVTMVDRYFPPVQGAALTYRVVNADGSVTYRSRNLTTSFANQLINSLDNDSFAALLNAAEIDLGTMEAADALSQLSSIPTLTIRETEADAQGNLKSQTISYSLVRNNDLLQFAVGDIGIVPPIPLLPTSETPQTLEGTLNGEVPYQATQEIDVRGSHPTALGELPDCVRVRSQLTVNDNVTENRTWYCAGIGEIADEYTDANGTRRTEIIAASVGSLIVGTTPTLPNPAVNATIQSAFPQALQGNLIPQLQYKDPTVSQGITTKILPVGTMILYGTQSGALVALDRGSEQEVWRFQTGGAMFSTPVVVDGIAYFGSADKKVYALRVSDGAYVWAYATQDIVSASPAVGNDTVYFASEDRNVYALDADTGRLRWTFDSGSPLIAPPVVHGSTLYVSNNDGALYALNADTGNILWDFAAGSAITAPVTVVEGILYFGSYDQSVYALDAADGKLIWSQRLNDYAAERVVVAGGRVYVKLVQEVFALDVATGDVVWRYDNGSPFYGAPLLMGNQLWFARNDSVIALDTATGRISATAPTSPVSTYTGVSSDGRELYVGFFDGQILSFVGATP